MHPWHDVELGDRAPEILAAVIEVPKGSKAKYRVDAKSGLLRLDQMLVSATRYPANFGFIPKTLSTDQAPLDAIVLSQESVYPLTIVSIRPVGVIRLKDEQREAEEKIIAVMESDPGSPRAASLQDLPHFRIEEIRQFFETYRALEGKKKRFDGFFPLNRAHSLIEESVERYRRRSEAA